MTRDIDKLIEETLNDEERELLDRYGAEQGFFADAFDAFRGPTAWVIWIVYLAQIILFFCGVYLAWRFFDSADAVTALRFGLSALLLFIMGAILKAGVGARIESNRIIREIKRLELRLALAAARESKPE